MALKFLPVLAAILACALWPQGVLLCMGGEGHVEVELDGARCCPSETGEDCVDCADFPAPNQRSAPPIVILAPPSPAGMSARPDSDRWGIPTAISAPHFPPRKSPLEGVKLLV